MVKAVKLSVKRPLLLDVLLAIIVFLVIMLLEIFNSFNNLELNCNNFFIALGKFRQIKYSAHDLLHAMKLNMGAIYVYVRVSLYVQ